MGCIKSGPKYEEPSNQDENKRKNIDQPTSHAPPNIVITTPQEKKREVQTELHALVPPNRGTVENGEKQSGLLAVIKSPNLKPEDLLKISEGNENDKISRINIVIPDDNQTASRLPIGRSNSNFDKAFYELTKLQPKEQFFPSANQKSEINNPKQPIYSQNEKEGQPGKFSGAFSSSGQRYGQNNPREQSNHLVIETIKSNIPSNIYLPEKSFIFEKDEINLQKIVQNDGVSNLISSPISSNPARQQQQNVYQSLIPNKAQDKLTKPIEPINQDSKALLQSKVPENGTSNIKGKENQISMLGILPKVAGAQIKFNVESELMTSFKFKMPLPFVSLEAQ